MLKQYLDYIKAETKIKINFNSPQMYTTKVFSSSKIFIKYKNKSKKNLIFVKIRV